MNGPAAPSQPETPSDRPKRTGQTEDSLIQITVKANINTDWCHFTTRFIEAITPVMNGLPFRAYIDDQFLAASTSPRAREYREIMNEIDSALTPEEHQELERLRKELYNL